MAEFKFACPQCSQHIQCDTDYAGTQIHCPTCNWATIVPQKPPFAAAPTAPPVPPPASQELSTSQSTRTTGRGFVGAPNLPGAQPPATPKSKALRNILVIVASVVALAGLGAGGWFGFSKFKEHKVAHEVKKASPTDQVLSPSAMAANGALSVLAKSHQADTKATSSNQLTRQLQILQPEYPKAYFFRAAEGMAMNKAISFEEWDQTFSRLMGIEGKALDEEVPGRSERNIEFFTRFKQLHPDQMVLLHFNGVSRDPRFDGGAFFAGHWVYYNGTTIMTDVPATGDITDIHVRDPRLFATNIGFYLDKNDDIGLCQLDSTGKPDWRESEQVQLIAVDAQRRTIRVRRACFGTQPRAFAAGRAYAAAHMTDGPWGRHGSLSWTYNFSLDCPKDEKGKSCADVLAADLAQRFLSGGQLATFDGIEFDIMPWQLGGYWPEAVKGPDCDADGKPDFGYANGINRYGNGVVEFCQRLQELLRGTKLVLADGQGNFNQRAFGILNGIESEGWPEMFDYDITDWSGGLNRHFFWQATARPPVLNYFNHKFIMPGATQGEFKEPDVPFSIHRLVFAAAQFTDAAICYVNAPPQEEGETSGIWDELRMGAARRVGWLGHPLGPPVRLAMEQPDLLRGEGRALPPSFVQRWSGEGVQFAVDHDALRIVAGGKDVNALRFRLRAVPCNGPDLWLSLRMHGDPMAGYRASIARMSWLGIAPPAGQLITRELPATGMALRRRPVEPLKSTSGAGVRYFANQSLGGEPHDSYLVHPPYLGGTGYTFWEREVQVMPQAKLEFKIGMGELALA